MMPVEAIGQSAPDWWTWAFWARDPESLRNLALAVAAVLGALVGVPLLMVRTFAVHRQSKAAHRDAETNRERRITDSFTRAVEQLGSGGLETRLGAIYALERIARESPTDHWPIMETLTAYVRERAPWTAQKDHQALDADIEVEKPDTDVQAALTVIGRRRREHEPEARVLGLSELDLRRSNLVGAHLEDANLSGTHLEKAFLGGAHLESAVLQGAHLWKAVLGATHMEGVSLIGAHVKGAYLRGTHLEGADLTDSNITQEQLDDAYGDETTKIPEDLTRPAHWSR